KYQLLAATRLARRKLGNVKLACTDARGFFRDRIADASLQAVHVYFPDPWWKQRHRKRRVFTKEFVVQVARALVPGGMLCLATDVQDYYDEILALLTSVPALRRLLEPQPGTPRHDLDYLTHFERKYRKEGRAVY